MVNLSPVLSPFFTALPPEIRRQIYYDVIEERFGTCRVHIIIGAPGLVPEELRWVQCSPQLDMQRLVRLGEQ